MTLPLLTADQTILKALVGTDRGTLTDQQMLDVLSYIRSMTPFGSVD